MDSNKNNPKKPKFSGIQNKILIPILAIIISILIVIAFGINQIITIKFKDLSSGMNVETENLSSQVSKGFDALASETKTREREKLDNNLKNLKSSGMGFIESTLQSLIEKGNIITQMNKTINLVAYNVRARNLEEITANSKNSVEYVPATDKAVFNLLLNNIKNSVWSGSEQLAVGLEVFDKNNELIAGSNFSYYSHKKKYESQLLAFIKSGRVSQIFNIRSESDGLALKV